MSWQKCDEPTCDRAGGPFRMVVTPHAKDLGGFTARRALPASDLAAVGPFVFFDEMGPADFAPGQGIDVRPHPHIGLATLTWLLEGEIEHRDSLGTVQIIRPGEVNWMTAGRGIVHSERTGRAARHAGRPLHGLQTWLALPAGQEEIQPDFQHYEADQLPRMDRDGVRLTLVAGSAFGLRSPVAVHAPTLYLDVEVRAGASLTLDDEHEERAVYLIDGDLNVDGQSVQSHTLVVLERGLRRLGSRRGGRCVVIGGAPLDGPRTLWWNFVSTRPERIEQAKVDWKDGRFPRVQGDDEYIPLPKQ